MFGSLKTQEKPTLHEETQALFDRIFYASGIAIREAIRQGVSFKELRKYGNSVQFRGYFWGFCWSWYMAKDFHNKFPKEEWTLFCQELHKMISLATKGRRGLSYYRDSVAVCQRDTFKLWERLAYSYVCAHAQDPVLQSGEDFGLLLSGRLSECSLFKQTS